MSVKEPLALKITVAICTWNRAHLLDQTLAKMRDLSVPLGVTWELLVVNNNCTDKTDEVIAAHSPHLPLRRLFEPNPGQSNARNCAVAAAQGGLILWTDDDVLVDTAWVAAYCCAAGKYPDASFFGGQILPWFEGNPPRWLQTSYATIGSAFALRDLGVEPFQLSPQIVPFGANFAVRTEAQRRYPYDPELGLRPGSRMGGEETTVIRKMLADGLTGWWVPGAKVRHFLPKNRQTKRYIASVHRAYGEYQAITGGKVGGIHWFGRPRYLWRKLLSAGIRYYLRRPWVAPQTWLNDLAQYATLRGHFQAYGRDQRTVSPSTLAVPEGNVASAQEGRNVKHFVKRIPIIGPIVQRLYRRLTSHAMPFSGSEKYWAERYDSGGKSGAGSYGRLAEFKAEVLNDFVSKEKVKTIIEYGCGDGNQLALAVYPSYLGFDVSPKAVALCSDMFSDDATKTFRLLNQYQGEKAELTLSLDVIYHLIEDGVFSEYMHRLFDSADRFVIVYSSNTAGKTEGQAPHVKHRKFSEWVETMKPEWRLRGHIPNRYPFTGDNAAGSFADFFIYERA